ncbi:hypothetical protein M432DRAFT_604009 [Thermoascus aurantiacus ATCC 26904]
MAKNRKNQKAKRDLAGAAARASGREKGRRNNSFRGVRVEDKAQNDNLFAVAQPNPLFGNFYYPVTFHSYQNTSGNGTPGYVGYYILNQPCPAAPYPAQLAAWWNRDFQFFDRFAGLQQPSQDDAKTNEPVQGTQTSKATEKNIPIVVASGNRKLRPEAPEFILKKKKTSDSENSGSPVKENVFKLPSSPMKTGLAAEKMLKPKL